jgi:hypothetical protein
MINLLSKLKVSPNSSIIFSAVTDFPTNPEMGTFAFKDNILYIFAIINEINTWIPLTNIKGSYVHTQAIAGISWTVTHNLNTTSPMYMIYDENGNYILSDVSNIQANSFQINFTAASKGKCIVFSSAETQLDLKIGDSFEKVSNTITAYGNLIPDVDLSKSVGSTTYKWKDLYLMGNSIYVGDNLILSSTGIEITPPNNASSINEIPQFTTNTLNISKFTYNSTDYSPVIETDYKLLFESNNSANLIVNSENNNVIISSSKFNVDASGIMTAEGSVTYSQIDGGTWAD